VLKLPIAERELRIGARSHGTYSSRRNFAALMILAFSLLYWNSHALGRWATTQIFASVSALCFIYALLAGLILAADSISSEKRDGTLGLLFLTALKPFDLIVGTISATSLKAFCGLLAAFPVLSVSFLLGGVESLEFARVCLTLVSALIFSLSLSLLASCLSRNRLYATSRAAIGLLFFTVFLPVLCAAMKNAIRGVPPAWLEVVTLFSPTTTMERAIGSWMTVVNNFWWSLLIINSMSAAMLLTSCLLLPRIWKDGVAWPFTWTRIRARFVKSTTTQRIRPGVKELNPFFWLASRQSTESTKFLTLLLLAGIAASFIGQFNVSGGRNPEFENQLVVWSFLLFAAHAVLIFRFAALSTSRLSEDRELGALESILVTPLRVREIIRGQWQALFTQLAGPALAVLFLHGLIFWAFLTAYSLDKEILGGVPGVLRMASNELRNASFEPFDLFGPSAGILGVGVILCLNWIAFGCFGMWIALRTRHASRALWYTLGAIIGPPIAAQSIFASAGVWLGFAQAPGPFWGWCCIVAGFAFGVLNAVVLIVYGWLRLSRDFRVVATERFSTPTKHSLANSLRWPLRLAAGTAALVFLMLLFYTEEKWRGLRAWRSLERAYAQRGEKLIIEIKPPAAIPDAENFGATKVFKPLFDYRYDASGQVIWKSNSARQDLLNINVTGGKNQTTWGKTEPDPRGNWALQIPADLAALQKYFQTNALFSALCTNSSPPQAILDALAIFAPEMNEIEAASQRPQARFPIHYDETHAAFWMHLSFLKNIARLAQLRATAKLLSGDTAGARADIQFSLRIANSLKNEHGVFPFRLRMSLYIGALQPLWDGLSRGLWDDESLTTFQKEFAFDALAAYPKAVREQVISTIDFLDHLTQPDEILIRRLGNSPINGRTAKFYPAGWKYLNRAGLIRLADETLIPFADVATHRVFISKTTNLSQTVRRSHVTFDPVSQVSIPWEVQTFSETFLLTAHTQVSLDQALIACAIERKRLADGAVPENLQSLAPKFLNQIPCDPLSGAPYLYKLLSKDRFILYSPGWNEKDDTAQPATAASSKFEQDPKNGDWVWKYPNP
jgi:hypothetical protein